MNNRSVFMVAGIAPDHQGKSIAKPPTPAIMNGHAVDEQPRPGERLKIAVG